MNDITLADVVAYKARVLVNPALCQAIEEAREYDPLVQHWFAILEREREEEVPEVFLQKASELLKEVPSDRLSLSPDQDVSEHDLIWRNAAEEHQPPTLDFAKELPLRRFDTESRTLDLKYLADDVPLGVARVVVRTDDSEDRELGSCLVAFRTVLRGTDRRIRQAKVPFDAIGLADTKPSQVCLHVVPVCETNLAAFSLEEVRLLRDECNENQELRTTVDELIRLMENEGK